MTRNRKSAKAAGEKFELATARYLSAHTGLDVSRRGRTIPDTGDIEGVHAGDGRRIVIECKNTAKPLLLPHLKEAINEALNDSDDGQTLGFLCEKLPGVGMTPAAMGGQVVIGTVWDVSMLGRTVPHDIPLMPAQVDMLTGFAPMRWIARSGRVSRFQWRGLWLAAMSLSLFARLVKLSNATSAVR